MAGYISFKIYVIWVLQKKEVIETADVIFDEDIVYRNDDINTAVREETLVLTDMPLLLEEDNDDLFEFDTDQYFEGPRIKLGTPINSPPLSLTYTLEREDIGYLPSPKSLIVDEESPKAINKPLDGHEADETDDIEDNLEFSGADVKARA